MPATSPKPLRESVEPEVLTLGEAASFLRVSEDVVLGLVTAEGFPGRRIGSEWRFLKRAVVEWLSLPARGSSEAVLRHFGAFRDDDDLETQLAAARAAREGGGR